MTWRWIRLSAIAALLAGLGACSNVSPPHQTLAVAEAAIRRAEAAHAWDLAPDELTRAQQKLAAARVAVRERANAAARRLAEQAVVDAQLATTQARTVATTTVAWQLHEQLDGGWRQFAAVAGDG